MLKPNIFLPKKGELGLFLVIYVSLLIRLYLATFTEGTSDVFIWRIHARSILEQGIINYYDASRGTLLTLNHPPLIATAMVQLFKACQSAQLDFGFAQRLVLGLSDFATAMLLFRLLNGKARRLLAVALYMLAPVTFILSSYHGNSDSLVALFALAALASISTGGYAAAGFLLGIGASIKWIIFLAGPALFFAIPKWKDRLKFSAFCALAFMLGYGWWITQHPTTVFKSVFGYTGQMFFTGEGQPIWGNQIFLRGAMHFVGIKDDVIQRSLGILFYHNGAIIFGLVLAFSWLRRGARTVGEVGATIAGVFCLFYAATNYWSFQYFAWAVPFYFFLDWKRCVSLIVVNSTYIYGLYAYFCESWLLSGNWEFIAHSAWPRGFLLLRDFSVGLYLFLALEFLWRALKNGGDAHLVGVLPTDAKH